MASLTYDELASAWGVSREAARKKVEGLGLRKQLGNDGRTRVVVDLSEHQHQLRSGGNLPPETGRRPPAS